MAIILAQRALGGRAHVAEYESGGGFGGYALEIGAVPSGNGRCKDAWCRPELRISVKADTEAICVVLTTSSVLSVELVVSK